jgi:hypothetical protein
LGCECVAILNNLVNRIQVYDINTGANVKNFEFQLSGPDGIGEKPRAFYIQNLDSIFIFDSWLGKVSLINSNGTLVDKYNLAPNGLNNGFAVPQGSTQRPLNYLNGKIYMAGLLLPWEGVTLNQNQFIEFDLENKKINYTLKRPDIYNKHNWGNNVMFNLNYAYNSTKNEFIFSFNNYEFLLISKVSDTEIIEYHSPSKYFEKINPYEEEFSYDWKSDKIEKYNYLNSRYWAVIYDEFNNVTYRFALRPNSINDYNIGVRSMMVSVIVFNDTYEVVGEFDLDTEVYDSRMYFVSKKGLHLANKRKFEASEDRLVFDIFALKDTYNYE